ncbi:MAG: DNA topoisomerase VI [Nanoarchaeota archaeon]|jgi:DNA topoisomerase-6 subunit A|nr:DNA topoisomerase VI [Nanoarchaeota archaeon]|tara:strand:- start:47397 stop:48485 length:1089 start_codon:yes stop_codon:yes gene_type:complete
MAKGKNKQLLALENLGKDIVKQIKKGKNPEIAIPIRALSNIKFDEKTKTVQLGSKVSARYFFHIAHAKKFLQTLEVAAISHNLIKDGKHASLRDVFYMAKRTIPGTKVNLVDDQPESDSVIEDLELVTDQSREQLNVNANKNGSVAGKVVIEDKGDTIDWSKLGSGGWSIPSNVEDIKFKKVTAKYILYMEKAAVWERLHEDKFWEKQNCIIMSSQGQTTRGIRRLLQRLTKEHKLPIYVLTDLDSWGHYIYSVIRFGSINLAHISGKMAIPSVRFLGITTNDIEKYKLEKHLIKFKDTDLSRLKQIQNYAWFKDNKAWQKEFAALKKLGAKAEIQALSSKGISFISEKYLPEKIKNKDFID